MLYSILDMLSFDYISCVFQNLRVYEFHKHWKSWKHICFDKSCPLVNTCRSKSVELDNTKDKENIFCILFHLNFFLNLDMEIPFLYTIFGPEIFDFFDRK